MSDLAASIPADAEHRTWDVVVIGAGAGGAAAGFNLARHGRSVLFLERGPILTPDRPARERPPWWPDPVRRATRGIATHAPIPMGCGTGGSTALFAMVMDRLRPSDLEPRNRWPISYDELRPYYEEAESLFRVRGTDDPLAAGDSSALLEPMDPSEPERRVHDTLTDAGLHPYRAHSAREPVPGCAGCFGRICPHGARNDAGRMCVIPALERHGAQILPECRVVRLDALGRRVHSAVAIWQGRRMTIRGNVFVLALNAFMTPALLQRSRIGTRSGFVGRNLMLHVSDSLLVRFRDGDPVRNDAFNHGITFNDFYEDAGAKLGNVHAHAGSLPVAPHATDGTLFHTIVEDLPYATNCVTASEGDDTEVEWTYECSDELRERSLRLARHVAAALGDRASVHLLAPACSLNIAHACGTCRFGDDPRTSVLDRNNRLHDADNAFVVDASCFPSSGGIHPSLTIVANSLRASAAIAHL
jgi:choline dehydrogenase-like flavoprotein